MVDIKCGLKLHPPYQKNPDDLASQDVGINAF
jgi:hypothetical protein